MALSVPSSNLPAAQQCCIASPCPVSLTLETSFPCAVSTAQSGLAPCCWCRDFPLSFPFAGALGFAGGLAVKNPPANAEDIGLIPGLGRSPGEGNDNPLQYSCLENRMDRGAWWAAVHGVGKSQPWLSTMHMPVPGSHGSLFYDEPRFWELLV